MDRSIGIPDDGAEYIGDVAPRKTLPAEMPDQPDFVDRLAIQPERPPSLGYQCFHFDLTPQSRNRNPVEIADLEQPGEFGADAGAGPTKARNPGSEQSLANLMLRRLPY